MIYYRHSAPYESSWQLTGVASQTSFVTLNIALQQQNLKRLDALFWDNADPRSPAYAKHLTRDQILKIVSPPQAVHDAFREWFQYVAEQTAASGGQVAFIKNNGDSYMIRANVHYVETLLQTHLHKFEDAKNRKVVKQLGSLTVPGIFS